MQLLVWIWVAGATCVMLLEIQGRQFSAGMPLAYFLEVSLSLVRQLHRR